MLFSMIIVTIPGLYMKKKCRWISLELDFLQNMMPGHGDKGDDGRKDDGRK